MASRTREPDSAYAWFRLAVSVLLSTIGGLGMWSVVVALPAVQTEFGAARAGATLPFTLTMIGFALGGVLVGRLADRHGITMPLIGGALLLGVGYVLGSLSGSLWQFALAQGLGIGLGTSASFAPVIADLSLWFEKRRGIAVAIGACGNYFAGVVWPPLVQHLVQRAGWRPTYAGIGLFCIATMIPLAFLLRPSAPVPAVAGSESARPNVAAGTIRLSSRAVMALLALAGVGCCVAMSMPQVHIVAYCGDLGYGVARGSEMLSVMMACGIVSRVASGFVADRIGGLLTLLLGSALQGLALVLYIFFDSLLSLYVISGLFGLFQGGIIPSYALIVREYFPAREAGARVGVVIMATLFGMALGGWMSGAIFDATGSYRAAFANGVAWNVLNLGVVLFLLSRRRRPAAVAARWPDRFAPAAGTALGSRGEGNRGRHAP